MQLESGPSCHNWRKPPRSNEDAEQAINRKSPALMQLRVEHWAGEGGGGGKIRLIQPQIHIKVQHKKV